MINKNSYKPLYFFLCLLTIIILKFPHEAHAQIFFSQDWDTGTPPANWPCKAAPGTCDTNAQFNGWFTTLDNCIYSYFANTGVSTARAHSGTRSFYMNRLAGYHSTCDIRHDFNSPYPTTINIRFYLYLDSNWIDFNTPVNRFPFLHFLFTNSALSGTGFRINLLSRLPWGNAACGAGLGNVPSNQPYMFFTCENNATSCGVGAPSPCYNLLEHLNEWQCVEFMFDATNKKYNVWINGTKYVDNVTVPMTQNNFTMIQFSQFVSDDTAFTTGTYIDDIVIADSYIGCSGSGGDTPPPSGGNAGGDASASGGSGCGFVKEDGKGQANKGEGVALMILLFLLLFLLRIRRSYQYKWLKTGIAKTMLFFMATALIFLLFAGITHAATYYVSPAGVAQWPACTNINTPCSGKTAMENAVAGDVIYFRGGVYNPINDPVQQWIDTPVQFRYQLPVWNPKNSGTEGNPITFIAYPGETPEILDAPDSAVLGAYRRDYIILDGFRATLIDEDPLSNDTHLVSQLIRFDESLHSVVRNCDFKGTKFGRHTNNALITIQRSHYMLIEGNKLHDNNGMLSTDTGFKEQAVNTNAIINFWSSDIVIRNNDIYNNYIGIWDKGAERNNQYYHNHIWGGSDYYTSCKQGIYMRATLNVQGPATGVRAYQNVIRNCGVGVQIEDVSYHDFPEVRVYNNTIVGDDSYHNNAGVFVADNARYAEIFNNIIVGYPVQVRYYTGASIIVSYSNYNDFYSSSAIKRWAINWSNDYSTIDLWRAATNFDINSIESNPQFINPGGVSPTDYKLQTTSPARIGRGGIYANIMGAYITGNETIGYDPDAPRLEIISPASSTVTASNTSITISGTATDTVGIVSITWSNDRGGSGTAWSGAATQNVNWTASNIPLQSGQNIVTVTATDGDNKTVIDAITVTVSSSGGDTGGNTGNSGGDASGGSGCGFVKDDSKGQRAKGEGVVLLIMLIVILGGVALAKRIFSLKGFILYKYISVFLTIIFVILLNNNSLNAAENTDRTKAEVVCQRSDVVLPDIFGTTNLNLKLALPCY